MHEWHGSGGGGEVARERRGEERETEREGDRVRQRESEGG